MKCPVAQALLLLGGGVAAALFYGSGTANATPTDIYVGGNTDCTSQGIMQDYQNAGDFNLNANNIGINYGTCDGSFAPFVGSTKARDAIAQGTAATVDAWNANCANNPDPCRIIAFSEGDAVAANAGNAVGADKPGSNTHVITNGNGWGETGFLGDGSIWKPIAGPIAETIVDTPATIPQVAGSENRNFVNDLWGTGGDQNPLGLIEELANINGNPPQHAIPHLTLEQPTNAWVSDDGVTQEIFNGTGPLPGVVNPADVPDPNLPFDLGG